MTSQANKVQIGGDHYKQGGEEHWDRQWRLHGRGYFVGCITKYIERYDKKNGVEDLRKARHFLDKLIELECAHEPDFYEQQFENQFEEQQQREHALAISREGA